MHAQKVLQSHLVDAFTFKKLRLLYKTN